jgi:hypothetical protein
MEYIVTCTRGVAYLENGFDGGELCTFKTGEVIRERDILKGRISAQALEHLEKIGRVKKVDGQSDKEAKGFKTK